MLTQQQQQQHRLATSSLPSLLPTPLHTPRLGPRQLQQGEQLTLQRVLGRGAFSTVYKGTWTRPGCEQPQPIAVKILLPQHSSRSCIHWEQFVDEATFLHSSHHRNALQCHGLVLLPPNLAGLKQAHNGPVLAMLLDYVKGGSLLSLLTRQMIEPHSRLYSLRQALHVLVDVADGLAHLHGSRPAVVHRDIKPGNVLLDKGRRAGTLGADARDAKDLLTARIADFGLHVCLDEHRPKCLRRMSAHHECHLGADSAVYLLGADAAVAGAAEARRRSRECASAAAAAGRRSRDGWPAPAAGSLPLRRPSHGCDAVTNVHVVVSPGAHAAPCATGQPEVWAATSVTSVKSVDSVTDPKEILAPCTKQQQPAIASNPPEAPVPVSVPAGGDTLQEASPPPPSCSDDQGQEWNGSQDVTASHATDVVVLSDGDEAEWVFDLTEATGSLVYMAPEVHLKLPYNTKADVYSFGVMMYEVLARTLLGVTCIGGGQMRNAEDYMRRVVGGWRPERPDGMAPELWQLLGACWQADPNCRPSMSHVSARLGSLIASLAPEDCEPGCRGCVIC